MEGHVWGGGAARVPMAALCAPAHASAHARARARPSPPARPPNPPDHCASTQVHGRGKQLAKDVDFDKIARRTPGFTGADLANLMNEAAILAARRSLKVRVCVCCVCVVSVCVCRACVRAVCVCVGGGSLRDSPSPALAAPDLPTLRTPSHHPPPTTTTAASRPHPAGDLQG